MRHGSSPPTHLTPLLTTAALAKLNAAPKMWHGGSTLTHFPPPLTTAEVAKLDANILVLYMKNGGSPPTHLALPTG
jgi:hypothetical protein